MTSESPEDQRDEGDSNTRTGSEATREQSGSSEDQRDEGDSKKATREQSDDGDDIPLNIAGHDDRTPPSEADPDDPFGAAGDDPDGESETVEAGEGDDEDDEEEVEPVEVLVQLADAGEIDPWDIDVVRVTDKFLEVIDEADLRTSGRALFYASVLIRMKSDAMLNDEDEEAPPAEPWEAAMAGDDPIDEPDPFASLEQEMDRRLERRRARGMPQTLDELVRDLREAERDSWWKESRSYDTSDSPSGFRRGTQELDYRGAEDVRMDDEPTADEVTANTHGEDIDAIVDEVYEAVREQYDAGREEVLFREVHQIGGSRVETFLGLLFLSHRGQVRLQQDELFGDLWIQDPNAVTGSEEALAD
ncbi:segregation/condensation protein A [Halomicrobium sp. IBSBa]|uniref:segregation and condensation protein A n=1 Tax=Halomicrobium sp. IBSBa TaxID=2778916 RepID=UPI001ABF080A|nr:ScpA family protein [Halomicrobium sp. IBSBa]MBO4246799.1 segregation/condensation protein A [Halomicrobium sp. IBSBa]